MLSSVLKLVVGEAHGGDPVAEESEGVAHVVNTCRRHALLLRFLVVGILVLAADHDKLANEPSSVKDLADHKVEEESLVEALFVHDCTSQMADRTEHEVSEQDYNCLVLRQIGVW